jgi:hypothetical protein
VPPRRHSWPVRTSTDLSSSLVPGSIVVPHSRPARLHDEVAALFGGFRIRPVILGRRKPQSKGQVERTIGYLETSFLPLRRFEDIEDLQSQHDQWAAEVAFGRYHRRVGAKVGDAWMAERGFLAPLPDPFPDTDRRTEVRVTKDGFCRSPGASLGHRGGDLLRRSRGRPASKVVCSR